MADTTVPSIPTTRYPMRRWAALWRELFGLSWQRMPGMVVFYFAANIVVLGGVAGTALALRWTIDATIHGDAGPAALAAALAALAYAVNVVLADLVRPPSRRSTSPRSSACSRASSATSRRSRRLDHLERGDVLDRVTIVRRSPWMIMAGFWSSVGAVFALAQLGVTLLLLGTISPGGCSCSLSPRFRCGATGAAAGRSPRPNSPRPRRSASSSTCSSCPPHPPPARRSAWPGPPPRSSAYRRRPGSRR